MRKILAVIKREYLQIVRTKGFIRRRSRSWMPAARSIPGWNKS